VAKLADAPDLGSGGEILRGSSPLLGSKLFITNDLNAVRPFKIEPEIMPAVCEAVADSLLALSEIEPGAAT
jgi:hypothetical protein